jgi:hypothetical protein
MGAVKLYSEIFEDFDKAKNKEERLQILRKNDHIRFRQFLIHAFDENIKFDVELPENYRPAIEPAGLNYAYLDSEVSKFYRFVENHPNRPAQFKGKKQAQIILVLLESLHKDEAALFLKLLRKDLGVKHLTKALVQEAFPGI